MAEDRLTKIYTFEPYFFKKKEVVFIELDKAVKYAIEDRLNTFKGMDLYHSGGKWVTEKGIRRYQVLFTRKGTEIQNVCAYINEVPIEDYEGDQYEGMDNYL